MIIDITGLSARCGGDTVMGAHLDWLPGSDGTPAQGGTDAQPAGDNRFFAELPLAPQNTVLYRVVVSFADGSTFTLADNRADPYYQLYQGRTVPLYCTDFETNPFLQGWKTSGGVSGFQWGTPTSGATDPHEAYSGTKILAQVLNGNYEPKAEGWVEYAGDRHRPLQRRAPAVPALARRRGQSLRSGADPRERHERVDQLHREQR